MNIDYDRTAELHAQSSGLEGASSPQGRPIDLLSQVLTMIRLHGELVYRGTLTDQAGVTFAAGPAYFYFVETGTMWVTVEGGAALELSEGCVALLPHGQGHRIADGASTASEDMRNFSANMLGGDALTLQSGDGTSVASTFVVGSFRFEGGPVRTVLSALPALVTIPRQETGAPGWLKAISHFLMDEAHEARPGAALMISRLIDLLVIRTLRTWAEARPTNLGWLGGLSEERIGRVLTAMHAAPEHNWTVESLANIAAMSRSIFSERFTAAVGESPLRYLTRWRLTIAADLLKTGKVRGTEAAQRAGYASDAAFSRAFKAYFGYAPSETRRIHF